MEQFSFGKQEIPLSSIYAMNVTAQISIYNKQIYRQIERPGWALSWTWQKDEVIWKMSGAEAKEQGDCTRIKRKVPPHSCMKQPVIIDLLPGVPYNTQTSNCCKAGVLTTMNQDPSKHGASFLMEVGNAMLLSEVNGTTPGAPPPAPSPDDGPKEKSPPGKEHGKNKGKHHNVDEMKNEFPGHDTHKKRVLKESDAASKNKTAEKEKDQVDKIIPQNFSIGIPGYTCGAPMRVAPTKFPEDKGRRHTQALYTWELTCTYSQTKASQSPTCCVSMSTFYNETIVPCPTCSCACPGDPTKHCIDPTKDLQTDLIQLPRSEDEVIPPKVLCTQHMCPIRIHWHVKTSYKKYWRVKVTVHNFNYVKNYSQWSLVVQHPNLHSLVEVFSFNYKPLDVYPKINDTGMFWGIPFYNDLLMQAANVTGNVQTEILLKKDPGFTFGGGFAFPRKISFNGDACVMPPPDLYPRLPNSSFSLSSNSRPIFFSMCLILLSLLIL
ncbi:hypothetical protein MKW94_030368 [Papaver nudicaule]|uniref:COBRA-like protein n=1 Tax=Papaver nudicaule TaxID=74823 RepID=A0AA41V718_PAPNU|nr:hypothetical protein [Papaver nudicaule]